MAAKTIKGITVEIGGDTTKLGAALKDSEKKSQSLQQELRQVNAALKFNPNNVELLSQKQKILADQIKATKEKLEALKSVEAQVTKQFKAGEIGKEQFRAFQREVVEAESKLKNYQSQLEATGKKASALDGLTKTIEAQEKAVADLKEEYKNAVLTYGENSKEAKALAGEIDKLSGELKDNKAKMTELDSAADDLDKSLDDVADSTDKASDGFTTFKGILANLAAKVIADIAGKLKSLATDMINVGISFEKSMSKNAALFKASDEELEKLTETAQHYGETTQFSASEAADALGYMALAGWDAEKASSELGGVLDLAAASGMGLAEASNMVTDYLSAFSDSEMTAAEFADKLAYAQANSNTTAAQLGEAYKNSAANLNAAGQDVETVTSLLASMANQGLKGSEAGTALTAMLRDLTKNMERADGVTRKFSDGMTDELLWNFERLGGATDEFNEQMKEYLQNEYDLSIEQTEAALKAFLKTTKNGKPTLKEAQKAVFGAIGATEDFEIAIGQTMVKVTDANGDYRDLTDILKDVQSATKGMGKAEKAAALGMTFTADSIKGLNLILNEGVDSSENFEESLRNAEGSASDMAETMNDNVAGALALLKSNVESKMIKVFDAAKGSIKDSVNSMSRALDSIDWDAIAETVGNFAEKIAQLFNYLVKNADKVLSVLKTVAAALATIFVVNKISNFIKSLDVLKTAFKGLWTVIAAHPVVAVVAAVAALTAGIIALSEASKNAIKETYGLAEEEKALIAEIGKEKSAYDEAKKAREEANRAIETESGYASNLWAELQHITEENGKIKKGYEDRAAVISGLLSEALGIEIEIVNGQIKKYDELKSTVEEVIRTKRAEALLDANKESYTTAIQRQAIAYSNYLAVLENAGKTQNELAEAEERLADLQENKRRAIPGDERALYSINRELDKQQLIVDTLREKYGQQTAAVDDAQSTYLGYSSTIKNYEGAMAAMASKDVGALTTALDKLSYGFVTAEDATESMLKNQLASFKKQYLDMRKAVEAGMPGVTQAQVDAMFKLVTQADLELKKLQKMAAEDGKNSGTAHADSLAATSDKNKRAAEKVASIVGVGLDSVDTKGVGKKKGNELAAGVESTARKAEQSGTTVAESVVSGAESVDATGSGKKEAGQIISGIESQDGKAESAGTGIASSAKTGAESVSASGSGQNFALGFINSIGNFFQSAYDKAKALAEWALSGLKKGQQEGSPSKLTYQSGSYFGQGYINAIKEKTSEAVKAAREMAEKTASALGVDDIKGFPAYDTPTINGATIGRQLDSTFGQMPSSKGMDAVIGRLDRLEAAILNSRSSIVLDTGVLVGETINKIDSGMAKAYTLRARGI